MGTSKVRLADRVAGDIRGMIFTSYRPGDRLPVENELAQLFSVSRITVREAIRQLNTMGIVDVRQGEGTFVSQLTPSSFMRPMLPMLVLGEADLVDIFEVRLTIECRSAEYAAQRATDQELRMLKTTLDEMDEAVLAGDFRRYSQGDAQFHNEIAKYSHNQVLAVINELIMDMIKQSILFACNTPQQMMSSVIYHNRIYTALLERNAQEASNLMKEHLSNGLAFVRETLPQSTDR